MLPKVRSILTAATLIWLVASGGMAAQTPLDRADPSVVEEEIRRLEKPPADPSGMPGIARGSRNDVGLAGEIIARSVRVEGAEAVAREDYLAAAQRFVGRSLSQDDLRELAGAVAAVARERGYGLATAWIPAQRSEDGALLVQVDEGRIDTIEAEGDAASVARRHLAALADGRPVPTARLERQMLLAGDVSGVTIRNARLERRQGRNVLIVSAGRDTVAGYGSLDNWGSATVGPVRGQLSVDLNGLLADDDRLTIGGVVTPTEPDEFGLLRIGYTKAIGTGGTSISAGGYYAYLHPGGSLSDRDVDGRSIEGRIEVSHPFLRSRAASLWGRAGLNLRESRQSLDDRLIREDNVAALFASAYGVSSFDGGYMRARVGLTQGIDAFGATREGDSLASRPDGSGIFSKVDFWAEYLRYLSREVSVQARLEGQVASRPLLSAEEIGLGGRYFLRGYDYREFSGDQGVAGALELRYDLNRTPKPVDRVQLYGFFDAGKVSNLKGGIGGGSLASTGAGIRFWLGGSVEATAEAGFPLSDGARGIERDPRLSFTLTTRF